MTIKTAQGSIGSTNAPADSSQFLTAFGEVSARLVNISFDNLDEEIIAVQKYICEMMNLDRCTLWQFSNDHESLVATHVWSNVGDKITDDLLLSKMFVWAWERIERGETLRIPVVEDLPPEASIDKENFRTYGVKSNVTVPLSFRGRVMGCVSFAVLRGVRQWTDQEVRHLELIGQLFVSAVDRKNKENALHETQAKLALASESAGIGFWGMDPRSGAMWVTDRTRQLLGLALDERIDTEGFFAVVLADDRADLHGRLERCIRSGESIFVDFRVMFGDGNPRWVSMRGNRTASRFSSASTLTGIMVDISERKKVETELRNSLEENKRLKDLLYAETDFLKAELVHFHTHPDIVGKSKAIGNVLRQIRQVSGTNSTVLITGETGTGKELVARAVHALSERKDRVMVKVDCASLPSGLIESELFGRERGAYTGALAKQIGRFQLADKSTIFLDEIGELPLEVQAKLLRILESGEFEPLGSPRTVRVNVRIIAATNRDLEKAIREGRFREDLYYRLRVFPIEVPSLRERTEDIPLLAYNFIRKFSAEMGKNVRNVRKQTLLALQQYSWPGNVRELRNLIEHAMITTSGDTLNLELPSAIRTHVGGTTLGTLAQTDDHHIRTVLDRTGWRIKGKGGAAELLGVKPSTLYAKMKKLGIPSRRQKDDMKT